MIAWVIALGIIAAGIGLGYYFFVYPRLTDTMKQQKEKYLRTLQCEKLLYYQVDATQLHQLQDKLKTLYFDVGGGCYLGQSVILRLKAAKSQVVIQLFGPTEEDLTRHAWKILHLRKQVGGA